MKYIKRLAIIALFTLPFVTGANVAKHGPPDPCIQCGCCLV